jgi:histidyl-tRNA synthetase
VGFGTGLERIILAMKSAGAKAEAGGVDVFLAVLDPAAWPLAVETIHELRSMGISTDTDYANRKMKGQMKQADRLGAEVTVIIGGDELAGGEATVKDMNTGGQERVALEHLMDYLNERLRG